MKPTFSSSRLLAIVFIGFYGVILIGLPILVDIWLAKSNKITFFNCLNAVLLHAISLFILWAMSSSILQARKYENHKSFYNA